MAVDDGRGRAFLPRTRKSRALLAVLAMATPKPVLRVQLADMLWSRREKEQARASLRQSVHELQDTLGPVWNHLFVSDRHNLTLRGDGLTVDALESLQPAQFTVEGLDIFGKVLLEDLNGLDPAFDRWLDEERARFLRVGRSMAEGALAKCGGPAEAIDIAERLLVFDRQHEGAWRAIMRGYAEQGDLNAALACYDRCRGALAEAGEAGPSPETEELISRLRPAPQGRAPALLTLAEPQPPLLFPPTRRERSGLRLRVDPLRVLGEDPNDGLAAGLAEEISAGLSRFRWISCVSASTGGLPAENPAEVDLVLEGSVQQAGSRVRTIVRLIDRRGDGEIVWAGRFDRIMSDPLSLQDELGAAIVAQVDPELMRHEGRRSANLHSPRKTGQDLLLQALPSLYRLERESFEECRRLLEASLDADPMNSVTHGWLAYWNLLHVGQGWAANPEVASAEAARLAERAVTLDPSDARALTLAGHVRGFLSKHPEEAITLHERALALNPNLALAWCFSGLAHFYAGRHQEAVRRIRQAIRLSPSDPHIFFFDMSLILPLLMAGDTEGALEAGRRAAQLNPLFSSTYKGYLAALGLLGRPREAESVLARLLQLEPGFSVEVALRRSPLVRSEDMARYAEGLRRAGLRERA